VKLAVTAVSALEATVSDAMVWEHFPHGADIGVRGIGATRSQAFEQAALALTAVIADPAWVAADMMVEIRCEAPDHELLFADWLNALIFEMAARKMLFGRFAVSMTTRWQGVGEPLDCVQRGLRSRSGGDLYCIDGDPARWIDGVRVDV
jgi:SHS2 domain-containing protein